MIQQAFASATASLSELARNPLETLARGNGAAIAILDKNAPAFYCVPSQVYEDIVNQLEDLELNAIADARQGQPIVKVDFDSL